MTDLRGKRGAAPGLAVALACCAAFGSAVAPSSAAAPARGAEEKARPAGSLSLVPDNVAFYGSMLRGREQIEAIGKSRAWAKLMGMPIIQKGLELFKAEFSDEGKLAPVYKIYQMPENKELLALLGDMFSEEAFMYGGESWEGFMQTLLDVNSAVSYGPLMSMLQRGFQAPPKNPAALVLEALAKRSKDLKVPDLVMGFKLKKKDRALAQIKRLEGFLKMLAANVPQLKGAVKREKIGGTSYLTFTVNGSMVPWDSLPLKDFEDKEGAFDALLKKLKDMKATVTIGIKGDYLLISLGESNAHLKALGQGKLLVDRKELQPLSKFADKRITGIGYQSRAMSELFGTSKRAADTLVDTIKGFLPSSLDEKQRGDIDKDLKDLAKDMKKLLPDAGAVMSVSYLTGHGYESFHYDWGHYPQRDGSKPLGMLSHVGGDPLFAFVGRSKGNLEQYRTSVKWAKIGYRYVEQYAVPLIPEPYKEKYEQFTKGVFPLLKKLDAVNATMLLPALKDGQVGFVIDAKIKSKQWIRLLPGTEKEMPMIELAILVGVSDPALLRKAFGQYRSITNDILVKVRELAPETIPELKIPKPSTKKVPGGDLYYYPFPDQWGVDEQILPNAALGETIGVLAISQSQSKRVLKSTPLKVKGGPLADSQRPLASALYFNWAGLLSAASPWIDLATMQIVGFVKPGDAEVGNDIVQQVKTVVEVLKVFRTYTSATYLEDEVWVSHSETVIRDIPAAKE